MKSRKGMGKGRDGRLNQKESGKEKVKGSGRGKLKREVQGVRMEFRKKGGEAMLKVVAKHYC